MLYIIYEALIISNEKHRINKQNEDFSIILRLSYSKFINQNVCLETSLNILMVYLESRE